VVSRVGSRVPAYIDISTDDSNNLAAQELSSPSYPHTRIPDTAYLGPSQSMWCPSLLSHNRLPTTVDDSFGNFTLLSVDPGIVKGGIWAQKSIPGRIHR